MLNLGPLYDVPGFRIWNNHSCQSSHAGTLATHATRDNTKTVW